MSSITDKIVIIRHANAADTVNIRKELARRKEVDVDLSHAEAVVALEDERMIGFGVLQRNGKGLRCLTLVENGRRRGIGLSVLRHLLENVGSVGRIAAPKGASHYLNNIGFRRDGRGPACGPKGKKAGVPSACCKSDRKDLSVFVK
jgi:N-acetylglutamate synthase-like GNAT family acetyltransferase